MEAARRWRPRAPRKTVPKCTFDKAYVTKFNLGVLDCGLKDVRPWSPLVMKRPLFLVLLSLTALAGCFYEAPVSLTPSRDIDRTVLGTWEYGEERGTKLQITEADAQHYALTIRAPKGGFINVGQMDFRAHHTKVASLDIVNVQLIDPKTKKPSKWALLSYTHPDADTIRIRLINERVVPLPPSTQQGNPGGDRLTTPDAMRKHIESVAERPDLFSAKEMVFTRTEQ